MTKRREKAESQSLTRRRFLRSSAVTAGCLIVPRSVLGAQGRQGDQIANLPPSERLNIAGVGLGARGLGNIEKCDGANVVALCDVDWTLATTAFAGCPDAAKHKDFRRMLDKEAGIDAVVISTPDHTHAVIAAEAMKREKHVYVETPLAHDVGEVRRLTRLAGETGVTTQMGNERHSSAGIRRAVEMIWGGGLGPIREVHCWTNRPQWPQGIGRPQAKSPMPAGLAWDLWLGPAPERTYDPAYHPYRWRGWLDFGTGALGAMGCHLLDLAFWGLHLGDAKSFALEAESTGTNGETYPEASTIRYRFPARADLPPVVVTWYEGGRQPPRPDGLPYLREIGSNGTLFVGEQHSMIFGPTVFGTNPGQVGPRTIPEFTTIENKKAYKKIPPVKETDWKKGNRHIQEWISACKAGQQPCASFEHSAPLTEMVLLGNVALLIGEPIEWDSEELRITNVPEANDFIRKEYRQGWSL
jgi:predicted dehydrogenase